jgi:ABC-2 type transport system permease protein
MVGLIGGVWAEKFDHIAVITNFIITPLTFLSGTFYSIEVLPEPFYTLSHANPFFYMIDGFRYGFIGHADGNILAGALFILALNAVLLVISYLVLRSGWRLKS